MVDQKIKHAHLAKIKEVFQQNFLRELTNDEAQEYLEMTYAQTRTQLQLQGFTEANIEKYLSGNLEIVFSPNAINAEILRVVDEIGIEALEASSKYKRMSEMVDATCLALALKKTGKGEWVIKGQDAPDILLIQPSDDSDGSKKPFRAIALEIMQIPEIVKNKFGTDIESDAAKFIQEKKFKKRYNGIPHLLVHLNFNHIGFRLRRLSEKLCEAKDSPFHQIWVRVNADPDSKVMKIVLVCPSYLELDFDFLNDRGLMY